MSQFTILYIGFSFSDYYLNDLRASLLTMIGNDNIRFPVAYAIIDGKEDWEVNFFRKHEGVHFLTYEKDRHEHANAIFDDLRKTTSARCRIGRVLANKSIFW